MQNLIFLKENCYLIAILTLLMFFRYPSETAFSLALALPLALIFIFIYWLSSIKIAPQPQCECGGYLLIKHGDPSTLVCGRERGHPEIRRV